MRDVFFVNMFFREQGGMELTGSGDPRSMAWDKPSCLQT